MKLRKQTIVATMLLVSSVVYVNTLSIIAVILGIITVVTTAKLLNQELEKTEKKRYKKISYTVSVGEMGIEIYPVANGWDVAQFTIKYTRIPIDQQKIKTGEQGNTIVYWEKSGERKTEKEKEYKRLNSTTLKRDEVRKLVNKLLNSDETEVQNAQSVVKAITESRKKTTKQKVINWALDKLFVLKTGHKPLPYPTKTDETTQKDEKQVKVIKKTS